MKYEEDQREIQQRNGQLLNQLLDIDIASGINKKFPAKFTTTFKDVHNVNVTIIKLKYLLYYKYLLY